MHVRTRIPATSSGTLAWWVKCALDGSALGCAPMFRSWGLPPLYQSGVRFAYENNHGSGDEEFATPPDVFIRGLGDCDDLVVYRVAELLADELDRVRFWSQTIERQRKTLRQLAVGVASGRLPSVVADWAGESLHVLVRMPDGTTEDPSILLGAPH